jgi:voltage-gated potassium channel
MDERSERVAKRFELPVLVAALLVIPLLILDQADPGGAWEVVEIVLDWGTWLVFAAEVVVMLAIVPDRRRWLREHPVDWIVTIVSPPLLPTGMAGVRLLRLLRVARLLRLGPLARRVFSLEGIRYAGILAFVTLFAGGSAFAAVERGVGEWEGIWFAAETMTTVGYGDITPHTTAGRLIAVVIMVVGIGFGTLLIGSIAERFIAHEVDQELEATEIELQHELREVARRLERIEQLMARRASAGSAPR